MKKNTTTPNTTPNNNISEEDSLSFLKNMFGINNVKEKTLDKKKEEKENQLKSLEAIFGTQAFNNIKFNIDKKKKD